MDVCRIIYIPVITATSVRHRSSTMFRKMEGIEEATIDTVMSHLGHDKAVNRNIYTVPPAERILQTVVPLIEELDKVHIQPLASLVAFFLVNLQYYFRQQSVDFSAWANVQGVLHCPRKCCLFIVY